VTILERWMTVARTLLEEVARRTLSLA
jgi:hypothetical protein